MVRLVFSCQKLNNEFFIKKINQVSAIPNLGLRFDNSRAGKEGMQELLKL